MTVKTQIIAAVVRTLAEKDILIHKPDAFTGLVDILLTNETYDMRIAKDVEVQLDRIANGVKKMVRNRSKIPVITTMK